MRFLLLPLALMLSVPVLAQQGGLGLYVGIGLADFGFEQDPGGLSLAVDPGVSGSLPGIRPSNGGAGPASTVVGPETGNIDGSAAALKLVAGWNITGNLGVEIGYSRTDDLVTGYSEEVGDLTVSANIATNTTLGAVRLMDICPSASAPRSRVLAISTPSRVPGRTLIWPLRRRGSPGVGESWRYAD